MGMAYYGLGMARPRTEHQAYSRNAMVNWFRLTGFAKYEPMQEEPLTEDREDYVPDLSFYRTEKPGVWRGDVPDVAVEWMGDKVPRKAEFKQKVQDYLESGVLEVFVCLTAKGEWTRYTLFRGDVEAVKGESFSRVLDVDLARLIVHPALFAA